MNLTLKPWAKKTLKISVALFAGLLFALLLFYFVRLEQRVVAVEVKPAEVKTVIREVVVTATPSAKPVYYKPATPGLNK